MDLVLSSDTTLSTLKFHIAKYFKEQVENILVYRKENLSSSKQIGNPSPVRLPEASDEKTLEALGFRPIGVILVKKSDSQVNK